MAVRVRDRVLDRPAFADRTNDLSRTRLTNGLGTAFNGTDGGVPVSQIGATVFASRFYSTIAAILPGVTCLNVQVSSGSSFGYSQAININQIPTLGTITLVLA